MNMDYLEREKAFKEKLNNYKSSLDVSVIRAVKNNVNERQFLL